MTAGRENLVLVAGGAGFIGSHLVDALLAEGARVVCLDNFLSGSPDHIRHHERDPRFELVEADIVDPLPASLGGRWTRIYNLACVASPPRYQRDPEHTLLTSVIGSARLLRLAEECGARYLLASTSEVYGDPEVHPQPESYLGAVSCTGPRACYNEGKRAAEALAFDFARAGRAQVRVPRLFNTYGPRMLSDDGRVVSNLVCQALAGADLTLYGDGSQTRSFCYVSDLVDGLVRLMESEVGDRPVNLGNPVEVSVRHVAERIVALTRSRSRIVRHPPVVDDPRRRCPDISLARSLLGWEPLVGLDEGLGRTVAWYAGGEARAAE